MGIADANYKISYIHFGTNKRISDGGVIERADFREKNWKPGLYIHYRRKAEPG